MSKRIPALALSCALLLLQGLGENRVATQNAPTQSQPVAWEGLGTRECYNQTCRLHQFCSHNPVRGRRCRNCSEIVGSSDDVNSWCHESRFEEFRLKYPSCEPLCWMGRHEKQTRNNRVLENDVTQLNVSLNREIQTNVQLKGELSATGKALQKALNAPCQAQQMDSSESNKTGFVESSYEKSELIMWTIVAGGCGLVLGCTLHCAYAKMKSMGQKRKTRLDSLTLSDRKSNITPATTSNMTTPLLRQPVTDGNPSNHAFNPKAPVNNDRIYGISVNSTSPDTVCKVTNVQEVPTPTPCSPTQTASESSGCSSGGTPSSNSSSSSLSSHKLCPSGNRTEAHLNDTQDFTHTASFRC